MMLLHLGRQESEKLSKQTRRIYYVTIVTAMFFTASMTIWGQREPGNGKDGPMGDSEVLRSGVVVEEVAKNSAADQAGIRAGDLVLSWSRDDAKGQIESPFDMLHIETEQGRRGATTLAGWRGDEKKTWEVAPEVWGVKTRPNFQPPLLKSYLEGHELAKAGKPTQAVERWRVAEHELRTPWLRSWFFFHIAESFAEARQTQEADRAYQEAVNGVAESEPVVAELILRTWGNRLLAMKDTDGAQKRYLEALGQSRRLGDESLAMAASLYNMGLVFVTRSDMNSAQEYFKQSLTIRERLAPDSPTVLDTLKALGDVVWVRGDLAGAEALFLRTLAIAEHTVPGTQRVANALERLGIIAGQRVALVEAERYLRRAIALEEKIDPERTHVGPMIGSLGNVLFERGDLAQAEEYYLKQLSIVTRTSPGSRLVAAPLNNLGNVAFERGDLVKAEDYYRQSLAIHDKTDHGGLRVANNLNSLGDVFFRRGDFAEAAKFYEQALVIRTRQAPGGLEEAESIHSLADAERALGDLGKAEEHYRQALEIRQKLAPGSALEADTLAALALIMQSKPQPDAAARLFEQALSALESQYARLGGSQDTRSGYRAKFDSYYRNYIGLLMQQKQVELAFHVLERSRARSLLEMLVEAHLDIHQGVDPKLLEREHTLQSELAGKINRRISVLAGKHTDDQVTAVTKEIEDAVAQYDELEGQIRATSPGYSALTQPQPLTAAEIQQQLLDKDTLILEYSLGEERSYLFAITQSSLQSFELPKRADIEKAASLVYSLFTERNRKSVEEGPLGKQRRWTSAEAAYPQAVMALGKMVLAPVASQLQSKRLLIVPDGALQFVPFAILPEPNAGGRTQVPLLVHHEIVNLPSASVLAVLRQQEARRQPAPKAVAVLADPVFTLSDPRVKRDNPTDSSLAVVRHANNNNERKDKDKDAAVSDVFDPIGRLLTRSATDVGLNRSDTLSLPRLPFSRREADAIMAVTPKGSVLKAVDFDANRETATSPELAQYRIVHFATHGLLDSQHPELSGLVLSLVDREGRHKDGFLQLQDIYNLNLPADLVVLSACETGLGKEVNGEGLIGMTRGFMYAGTTRVVSSLWKVDDFATAKLMKAFYTSMERDGKRPAEALREAQLSLINDRRWSSPYYWAGFTIQGEWK